MTTTLTQNEAPADIRTAVRERYGKIASQGATGCCEPAGGQGSSCCGADQAAVPAQVVRLYETPDAATLPPEVTDLSLGCGDPVTLASLRPGQTVLDLGAGGGIDCFLAAKQVGAAGHVIGVDMTPEMLEKARANKARLEATNVEFRLGEIEHLPVADATVDVVISNCVINLSPDKPQVFREALRVLRPGGRLAVSDIVTNGPLPDAIKRDLSAWAGCVAGAWEAKDYVAAIEAAGFVDVSLTPVYMDKALIEDAVAQLNLGDIVDANDVAVRQAVFSAKVTAQKPI
jgi:SAM-dependent methyltransferase